MHDRTRHPAPPSRPTDLCSSSRALKRSPESRSLRITHFGSAPLSLSARAADSHGTTVPAENCDADTWDQEQIREKTARGERIWRMLMVEECRLRLVGNSDSGRRGGLCGRPPRHFVAWARGGVVAPMTMRGSIVATAERSPRRGNWDSCVQMPECVKSADDLGGRSGQARVSGSLPVEV